MPVVRGEAMKWGRGKSDQSKRTKLKRWGPEGYREFIESQPCCVCGFGVTDAAHVVPRSRGGGWENNLVPLCRTHHIQYDTRCNSYPDRFAEIHLRRVDLAEQAKTLTTLYKTKNR